MVATPSLLHFHITSPGNLSNFNRFVCADNNPVNKFDPTGRNAVVALNKDGSISIKIPVRFSGPAATPGVIAGIKNDVSAKWSGLYNVAGQITKVSVAVVEVDSSTPQKAINNIALLNGPTSDKSSQGASYVQGGNSGEWNMSSSGQAAGESAHEAGHLMGDGDHYSESTNSNGERVTTPDAGYSNNLMGTLGSSVLPDSRNIDAILRSPKNVIDYQPPSAAQPPPLTSDPTSH